MKVVLASGSPRRREILSMLGIEFEIKVSDADETVDPNLSPADTVMAIAAKKSQGIDGDIVISADTIVCLDGKIIGKPSDYEDAFKILKMLSGRTHEVYTGVCVNGKTAYELSEVAFNELSDEEIKAYILTGEPMDKAGAYAAQGKGACFVREIKGDFFNVMGLPVHLLYGMLKNEGFDII